MIRLSAKQRTWLLDDIMFGQGYESVSDYDLLFIDLYAGLFIGPGIPELKSMVSDIIDRTNYYICREDGDLRDRGYALRINKKINNA